MGRGVHNQTCNVYDGIKKWKRHEISNKPISRKNDVSAHCEGAKTGIYKTGSGSSQRTESASPLILDFPASRTMRNKSVI